MAKSHALEFEQPRESGNNISIRFSKIMILIVAISYGGGLWVNLQHELEGEREITILSPVLHWLRDSTLSIVFIFFGVLIGLAVARRLIEGFSSRMPVYMQTAVVIACIAIMSGAALALGIPVHGYLFGAHLDQGVGLLNHMAQDGAWAALVNGGIAALMILVMNGLD